MEIQVAKYHGCGNDFILLDWSRSLDWSWKERSDFAKSVCDRNTGIGADGCIFVKTDPLEMVYFNQDGSRADMCGNGIRCFAAYCFDFGLVKEPVFTVGTLAGPKTIEILSQDPFWVRVNMGRPVWDNEKIGVALKEPLINFPLKVQEQTYPADSFYMGTIHTVVFVENAMDPSLPAAGKALCHHPLYSRQTNVNFVEVLDESNIRAVTYERGCGMTLACGTGMCAAVTACVVHQKTGPHVDVHLKKGRLHIDIDPDQTVWMEGPAVQILKGNYNYDSRK